MVKRVVLLLMLFAFILTSCALPGGSAKEENPPPKEEMVVEKPVAETKEEVVVEESAPEVEVIEPTAEEVAPAGFEFRDDFDIPNDEWSEDFILTTQAGNRDIMQTQPSTVQDGILEWRIRDAETYIYKFVNNSSVEDVVLEAKWISKGQSLNGIALVCRAAEDYSSWYEARISAQGDWAIYRYDKSIKDNDPFKNPYVTLKQGKSKPKLVRPAGDNITKFSCVGPNLQYEVNGLKGCVSPDPSGDKSKECRTTNIDLKGGGLVGVGVMSSTYLPAQILFDYFSATAPE